MKRAVLAALVSASTAHALCSSSGCFGLFYKSSWPTAYLHFNPGSGWNGIPGAAMQPSTNASYPASAGWQYVEVSGNDVTFVLTNGAGSWDNNGGRNYEAGLPGSYALAAFGGTAGLTPIVTATPGCAPGCAPPRGTCGGAPYYLCTCAYGYYGPDCEQQCPGMPTAPCSGHGTCTSAGCACSAGWGSCGNDDCATNLNTDPNNCGACGTVCAADPAGGVLSSQCTSGACVPTCAPGYILCPGSNTCAPGSDPSVACPLPGCQTYSDNQCSGNDTTTPASYAARRWQTPVKGSPDWVPAMQSYASVQAYPRLTYASDHKSAVVSVVTFSKNPAVTYSYSFVDATGGTPLVSASPNITACAASAAGALHTSSKHKQHSSVALRSGGGCTMVTNGPLFVTVTGSDGSSLALPPAYLMWGAAPIPAQPAGDYRNGQKGAIVEMFGWPHKDVGDECAFLAEAGYLGAKLFPVMEQVMSWEPFQNALNPWFFAYQSVSYVLDGRMGSVEALADAITRCRSQSVRLYADAVVNHMVGGGNDGNPYHRNSPGGGSCVTWGAKTTSAALWHNATTDPRGPSPSYTQDFAYLPNANTGLPPSQEFPAVPYGPTDFHCERALNSWTDPLDLNAGWLDGLVDLNTEVEYVQQRIADYYTALLSIGFSGMRIDAAKHIRPEDHVAIFSKLKANLGGVLPPDFFVWMEVLTGGEGDMLVANNASGYNYGGGFTQMLYAANFTGDEISRIKLWADYYPKQPNLDAGTIEMNRKAIQNDDADQQTPGSSSRDMGDQGCVLVKDCSSYDEHIGFEVKLFQSPNGAVDNANDYPIRLILSGFFFDINQEPYGFPDGWSDCSKCQGDQCSTCTNNMPYAPAYLANGTAYTPSQVYSRVHRDPTIIAAMRTWMGLP